VARQEVVKLVVVVAREAIAQAQGFLLLEELNTQLPLGLVVLEQIIPEGLH
jgi:hypothetical protein